MNVEITGGRVVDPAQDLDRVTSVYVALCSKPGSRARRIPIRRSTSPASCRC